jgi:uncharacterized protein YacL (UPF0231 family)
VPDVPPFNGLEIEAKLRDQWTTVKQAEAAEKALYQQAEAQRQHIEQLKADQRHLHKYLPALHLKRELRDEKLRARRRRGETIRGCVANHALEAQDRLDKAWDQLNWTRSKVSENVVRIAHLEHEIRELCAKANVRDPEHAYSVLMGDDEFIDDDNDDNYDDADYADDVARFHHDDGYGCGHKDGYEYGDGLDFMQGPWSAASLARAEEDLDRYVAEKNGKEKDMGTGRDAKSYYYDDHDSGISDVYGGGGGDRDSAQTQDRFEHYFTSQSPYGTGYGA